MVDQETVTWVKEGLSRGTPIDFLLKRLSEEGYSDTDIEAVRSVVVQPAATQTARMPARVVASSPLDAFLDFVTWLKGIYFSPKETLREIAERAGVFHMLIYGMVTPMFLFAVSLIYGLVKVNPTGFSEFTETNLVSSVSILGNFNSMIVKGGVDASNILFTLMVVFLGYFLVLFGISFAAFTFIRASGKHAFFSETLSVISVPYGCIALGTGIISLILVPIDFVIKNLGEWTENVVLGKVIMGVLGIFLFFKILLYLYTYVTYAVVLKERHDITMAVAAVIAVVATIIVLLAIRPLIMTDVVEMMVRRVTPPQVISF